MTGTRHHCRVCGPRDRWRRNRGVAGGGVSAIACAAAVTPLLRSLSLTACSTYMCAVASVVASASASASASTSSHTPMVLSRPHTVRAVVFVLRRDAAALQEMERFFWDVSNPLSDAYGRFLSQHSVTSMLGQDEAAPARVVGWIRNFTAQHGHSGGGAGQRITLINQHGATSARIWIRDGVCFQHLWCWGSRPKHVSGPACRCLNSLSCVIGVQRWTWT